MTSKDATVERFFNDDAACRYIRPLSTYKPPSLLFHPTISKYGWACIPVGTKCVLINLKKITHSNPENYSQVNSSLQK